MTEFNSTWVGWVFAEIGFLPFTTVVLAEEEAANSHDGRNCSGQSPDFNQWMANLGKFLRMAELLDIKRLQMVLYSALVLYDCHEKPKECEGRCQELTVTSPVVYSVEVLGGLPLGRLYIPTVFFL